VVFGRWLVVVLPRMARINRFEDLDIWKLAREITNAVYDASHSREFSKDFGLRGQICRASVSVMSNIAEGFERDGDKEFANFLSLAKGSLGELRSQLYIAFDRGYIGRTEFDSLYAKTVDNSRRIAAMISYLRRSAVKGIKFK
jgi:four helix bundle protein